MFLTRREFVLNGCLPFVGTVLFPTFSVGKTVTKFKLNNAHEEAAQKVRNLANGRTINLRLLYPKGALGNIGPITKLFHKMTGITIELVEVGLNDINTQIILSSTDQTSEFDLALPSTFGLPDLVEASALKNLDQYAIIYEPEEFQTDTLFSIGDYYKGSLYGYQTDGDTYLMFYNKSWIENPDEQRLYEEKFGSPLRIPETWEELDQMIAYFYRPEKRMYGGSLFRNPDFLPWEWWMRFHAKGYFPFDDKMTPQINNDSGVKALEEMIAVSQYLEPSVKLNGLFDNMKSFSEGNKFCDIGWGGSQKTFNNPSSKVRGKLLYSPAPGGILNGELVPTSFFNWGWNYTVAARSKESEIAYLFTLFATSPHVSTIAVREASGYFDPFRNSHYEDPEIIKSYSEDFLVAHKKSMSHSIPDLYLKGQGQYFAVLRENMSRAYQNRISPKRALDQSAKQWRQITRKMGADSQREQWKYLKSKYPEKLRTSLI
jgi:multiple sugar transport system substrate-binding protein